MKALLKAACTFIVFNGSSAYAQTLAHSDSPRRGSPILVDDYGAAGDGVTYDDAAFAAAEAVAAERCGVVQLGHGKSYHLAGHTVPPCVSIRGHWGHPGAAKALQQSFAGVDSIYIDGSSATGLVLSSSSQLSHLLIQRYGIAYPNRDASGFAGTAISGLPWSPVRGPPSDISLEEVMALGFAQGFYCGGCDRVHVTGFYGDNLSGIFSANSFDNSVYRDIHLWNYTTFYYTNYVGYAVTGASGDGKTATVRFSGGATIPVGHLAQVNGISPSCYTGEPVVTASSPGSISFASTCTGAYSGGGTIADFTSAIYRSGTGIVLAGQQDGTFLDEAFAGGYQTDFRFGGPEGTTNTGNMMIGRIQADAFSIIPGQIGVDFERNVGRTTISSISAASGDPGRGGAAVRFNIGVGVDIYASVAIGELFTSAPYPGGRCIEAGGGYVTIAKWDATDCAGLALAFTAPSGAYQNHAHLNFGATTITASSGGIGTSNPLIEMCAGCSNDQLVFATPPSTDQAPGAALVGGFASRWRRLESAASLNAPFGTNEFELAGDATVTQILGSYPGRELWLFMSGGAIIRHGGNICLQNNANFQAARGNIRLKYDASDACWREVSRAPLNPAAMAGNALPALGAPIGCSVGGPSGPVSAATFTLAAAATSCAFNLATPFQNNMVCNVQPTTRGCPLAYPNATRASLAVIFGAVAARGCTYAVVCNGW